MAEIETPSWMQGFVPQPNTPPRGWQPGQSGNPKGRPAGSRNKKNVVADEFAKEGSAVARVVMDAALAGDMQAANMVLQRLSPPLRAAAERVQFELDPERPLAEQAKQILAAVADGKVDPETGKTLIGCLSAVANIEAVAELESRIIVLEARQV
ncbi:hypothetical protein SAMN06265365_1705 [Tistlia consotensis]|uniref:DUF5681 domain-containing protein n=1 Tax=Tistlia consotensis USBA 355 TaxID=560819 RepID=A0A1Y6CSE4_9PROT|nr:DUF5681 domain-containing protein [Tistlia consotensis]SMF85666.1 hypothetical protein SAMN05428998_1685 [Tistlia consotensis USBA 355]SNS40842.1 hypothetical protein SAMN06265365_1705 [Tistlia consotensis]